METSKMLTLTLIDFRKSNLKVISQSTRPIVTNSSYWRVWSFCKRYGSMLFNGSHCFAIVPYTFLCHLEYVKHFNSLFYCMFQLCFLALIVGLWNTVYEPSGTNLILKIDSLSKGWGPVSCLQWSIEYEKGYYFS